MKFGEKLQQLRREKGFSQEMLAERLDVSRQAVSKWESGQAYPEMDKLIILCEIFGTTLDRLVRDGKQVNGQPGSASEDMLPIYVVGRAYEYKSERTLWGLPLVHVNIGLGKKAKGIIALGTHARGIVALGITSAGLISLGVASIGFISLGTLAIGALAAGAISLGGLSVGGVAVGIFAIGGVAVGVFSTGGLAAASHIAIGGHAYGHVAVGRVAEGVRVFIDQSSNFAGISRAEVQAAIREEFPGIAEWIVRAMTSLFR